MHAGNWLRSEIHDNVLHAMHEPRPVDQISTLLRIATDKGKANADAAPFEVPIVRIGCLCPYSDLLGLRTRDSVDVFSRESRRICSGDCVGVRNGRRACSKLCAVAEVPTVRIG